MIDITKAVTVVLIVKFLLLFQRRLKRKKGINLTFKKANGHFVKKQNGYKLFERYYGK